MALYFTYTALEEEIERNKEHPQFAPLYFPNELHRRDALARDLEYFYGEDWQSQIVFSPATRRYVERIRQVGRDEPALLVAHAYTRYMGDLSGGQVLGKVAQRAMKLPSTGEGLSFYQFDGVHNAKAFKQLYRSRMNELELDVKTKEKVVEEANRAFHFNMEVRRGSRLTNTLVNRFLTNILNFFYVMSYCRCSENWRRLEKPFRRTFWMQLRLTVKHRETSASVRTTPPKRVNTSTCIYCIHSNTQLHSDALKTTLNTLQQGSPTFKSRTTFQVETFQTLR